MEQLKYFWNRCKRYKTAWVILMLVALVVAPFVASNLQTRVMTTIFIYCLLSMGNMLISGHTGMLNMGHAAFWGVGAYIAAVLQLRFDMYL